MDKYDVMELVLVILGIVCLIITVSTWLKVLKEWKKEENQIKESETSGGRSNKAAV